MSSAANSSTLIAIVAGATAIIYFATVKLLNHDPREPPLAPQWLPFIGHLVGLSRRKFNYYVDVR